LRKQASVMDVPMLAKANLQGLAVSEGRSEVFTAGDFPTQRAEAPADQVTDLDPFEASVRRKLQGEGVLVPHVDGWSQHFFLWSTMLTTVVLMMSVPFTVDWAASSFLLGFLFCALNSFLVWNVADIFVGSVSYHMVRIFAGFTELPRLDLLHGLPDSARTLIQFCLLSGNEAQSTATFENAYACFLRNLDPNGNMACALVSVTNKVSVVEKELSLCAELQRRFVTELSLEANAFVALCEQKGVPFPPVQLEVCPYPDVSEGLLERWYFWTGLCRRAHDDKFATWLDAKVFLLSEVGEMAKDLLYLHRNCRVRSPASTRTPSSSPRRATTARTPTPISATASWAARRVRAASASRATW